MEDSQGCKESYESNPGFHTPDPKKAKTDSTFNVSFDEYTTAVNAVNSIQNDKESAHTNPLWWGVLDFREEDVSPSPSLPRAKNFLSANEIDHLMNITQNAIQEENEKISKSAKSLLEALLLSEIVSLQLLAKECGARGVVGVLDLLQRSADKMQDVDDKKIIQDHLANVDADDDTTIYVGRCIEDTYEWSVVFMDNVNLNEPSTCSLLGLVQKPRKLYSHMAKTTQTLTARIKRVAPGLVVLANHAIFYIGSSREAGNGENSGPTYKDNHDKAKTNFVDTIKVSRAQHIKLELQIIEQSGKNPLPESLQKAMTSILIPFFHIVGMRIWFYLLFQISGDLYGVWDWTSEYSPTKDTDVGENLVERVGRMSNILAKRSKTFKGKKTSESSKPTVGLNKFRTPVKKAKTAE
ncbi:10915_t:CDS:2 [Acaulospora morrowiae]|uniref:10915_t:CDS:1 n=1 Tax=Acaulospora morrowiae TaxID=94023 RepID=A0A9N9ALB1_9GLOM|nr:10915_t:CDS:2 [Acaulospora morrowiae]